jgi:hypothetical protein
MTNSSSDSDYDFGKILGIGTNKDNKVVIRNICSTENINNIQELDNNLEKKADSKLVVNENRDPTSSNFTLIENCNNSDLHKKNNKNSQNFKDFVKNKLPNKQLSKGAENNYNLQERISKKLKVISQANQFAWIERLDVTSEKVYSENFFFISFMKALYIFQFNNYLLLFVWEEVTVQNFYYNSIWFSAIYDSHYKYSI